MELKIKELLNANQGLRTLANAKGLSSIIAYRISRNIEVINNELKAFEKAEIKALDKYFERDSHGEIVATNNSYKIKQEFVAVANKEIEELQEELVQLNIRRFNLEDIDKVGLTPLEISSLKFMINLEEDE